MKRVHILTSMVVVAALACDVQKPVTPIVVPISGHVTAVVDRWTASCVRPSPPYKAAWDSTLADTALVFAAPNDVDSIAGLFGVVRRADGSYWYEGDGRTSGFQASADSSIVGRWLVVAGQYTSMSYVDDIDVPVDADGHSSPEHYRQDWWFAAAPNGDRCAIVVAWRSPKIGSFRGSRYVEVENAADSVRAFVERIQWRGR